MENLEIETAKTLANHDQRLVSVEHRIKILEGIQKNVNDLALSVNNLAISMKSMLEEQKKQGERIENLEKEPADNWKMLKKTILTAVVSAIAGSVATGFLLTMAQNL